MWLIQMIGAVFCKVDNKSDNNIITNETTCYIVLYDDASWQRGIPL